jgi:hypothetical protein
MTIGIFVFFVLFSVGYLGYAIYSVEQRLVFVQSNILSYDLWIKLGEYHDNSMLNDEMTVVDTGDSLKDSVKSKTREQLINGIALDEPVIVKASESLNIRSLPFSPPSQQQFS